MPGLEKNRIYRAHIDGYSSQGLGIARIDGQVVFVHGAVRGETCDVLVMKVLKNAAFGKIAALGGAVSRPAAAGLSVLWPLRRLRFPAYVL